MKKEGNMGWIAFALLAAVTAAIVSTLSKAALKDVDSTLAFAIQSVLIIGVSWAAVLYQGQLGEIKNLSAKSWTFLIIAGIITACSSFLSFSALKLGNASQVAPLQQMSFVFAIIFAVFFLREKISLQMILGAVLMIGGAILIAMAKK